MLQWEPFASGHIGPGGRSVRQRRAGRDGARPYRNAGNTQGAKAINAQCRFEICRAIVALVSHKAGCSE